MTTPAGPGKFSQRTDKAVSEANRSLPNAGYGEQATYQADQAGMKNVAPNSPSPNVPDFNAMFGNPASQVTGLGADSAMPDTPVTDGAATGPGAGTEVLNQASQDNSTQMRAWMPALQFMADSGNSDSARNLIRQVQSQM